MHLHTNATLGYISIVAPFISTLHTSDTQFVILDHFISRDTQVLLLNCIQSDGQTAAALADRQFAKRTCDAH